MPDRVHSAAATPSEFDERVKSVTIASMMASGCFLGDTTRCGTVNSAVSDLTAWLATALRSLATVGT